MRSLTFCFTLLSFGSFGQEPITLQVCIEKALNNKNNFISENAEIQITTIEKNFHPWSLTPNLVASTGLNTSFGRRLDPFTNTFASTAVNSQSFGLTSSAPVFNGFSYIHKRSIIDLTILKNEIIYKSKENEIQSQVIETYISLCKLSAQIQLAKLRSDKHQQIQEIQKLLIIEGKINSIDTLKSYNSLLYEKYLLQSLNSDYQLELFELNFLIGSPLTSKYSVVISSISQITSKLQLSETYTIDRIKNEFQLSEEQLLSERSEVLPTLSVNALLGTGFSTNNKNYSVAGNPTKPYTEQINQNLYEGIGLYLSIPIFNRGSWLKAKQQFTIRQQTLESSKEFTELKLEKQKLELEQNLIKIKADHEQKTEITNNLQTIYEKSIMLYKEGRCSYTELETIFMEWQTKLLELERVKLEYENIKLYE